MTQKFHSRFISKRNGNICPHRNWTWMFIAVLFTTAKRYKQRKGPWTDEWINKWWSIHYNGMLFSHEKKEVLKWAAMWMNFNVTWSLKGMGGCLGDETVLKPEMVTAFHEHTKIPLSCYNFKTIIVCYVNFTTIKIFFEKVQTQKTIKLGT